MLIPIGLEKNEVRRNPWISYGIITINVLVFLSLWFALRHSTVPARANEKLQNVLQYLFEHPYLNVPAQLEPYFGPSGKSLLLRKREEYAQRTAPPVEWAVRRQQQRLNEMAADVSATLSESPIFREGFVPADPDPIRLVTSMFVHVGWLHLIGNMLFFFATGPFLEDVYGRVLFSVLYFLSGLAAIGAHVWQNPGSAAPIVGASGAIAGVLGAFLVRFARSKIRFLWLPIPVFFWWRFRVLIPAFLFLPLWFLEQFWLATSTNEAGGVALWAHVGGFAFGVAFGLAVWATGIEKRLIHPSIESQIGWAQNQNLVLAIEAATRGNLEEARRETDRVLQEDPTNLDARRYAYEVALDARNWRDLAAQATRLLELYLQHGETGLARDLIEEATRLAKEELPARFLLRAGDFLSRQGDADSAFQLYGRLIKAHWADPAALRALFQAADLHRRAGRLEEARQALDQARSHPALSEEWATMLDQRLRELEKAAASGYRGTRPSTS
jgi:membrane associated rhomboid family serine protease